MGIRCPKCRKEYDVKLFKPGKKIVCGCGYEVNKIYEDILKELDKVVKDYYAKSKDEEADSEEEKLDIIERESEKIAFFILSTDYQKIDIEIEKRKLKDLIKRYFPDKLHLYHLIYEPRFKRLWQQFREH